MIHYQLRCSAEHSFDGWFRDGAAFDTQSRAGQLACPVCGATEVKRGLMAPAIGKPRRAPTQLDRTPDPAPPVAVAGGELPDALRAMLQRVREEIEKRCDYVGPGFAEEARRIAAGESERRGIYGEATPEEAEQLAEDGIDVTRIPWVPRADG